MSDGGDASLALQEAVDRFRSLAVPMPADTPVGLQLKSDIEFALQRLEQCNAPLGIDLLLKLAYAFKCVGRLEESAKLFEQIKDATGSTRLRIIACIEQGVLLARKSELEAGLTLAEEHPEAFNGDEFFQLHFVERGKYQLGKLQFQEEDFMNAAANLEAGFQLQWGSPPVELHYMLGVSYGRIGDHNKAVEHLKAYISLGGPGSDVYQELGDNFLSSKRYREASEAFDRGAALAREAGAFGTASYRWWCAGAVAVEHCEDHEQASQYLRSSLKAALEIQDPQRQASRLLQASTWLNLCVRTSLEKKPVQELLQDMEPVGLQQASQESLNTLKAEALGTLGISMLANRSFDDARELLQNAVSLLSDQREEARCGVWRCSLQSREKLLLYRFQWAEAALYSILKEHQKALETYQQCKANAPSEKERVACEIRCCLERKAMGDFSMVAATLAKLEAENASLLEVEWKMKAELLLGLGQSLLGLGNSVQALVHLKAAKKILEDNQCYTAELLPITYGMLYMAFVQNGLFPSAFELTSCFQQYFQGYENDDEQLFHLISACTSRMLVDNEAAKDTLTEMLKKKEVFDDPKLKSAVLSALGSVYRNQEDYNNAEVKYDEALQILSGDIYMSAQLHLDRAGLYMSKATVDANARELNRKALEDYDRAIQLLEEHKVLPVDLANAYTGQAVVLLHLDDYEAANAKLDKAMSLAGDNQLLKAKIKRVRAHLLARDGDMDKAIYEARQAALLFAEVQLKLQHLESAWVTLLEGDMKHLFFLLQTLWVEREKYLDAVLWAERGRMRLYFYLADRRSLNSDADPLTFDREDDRVARCVAGAVKGCGKGTVVVEYSYSPARTRLYIYVVHAAVGDVEVEFKNIDLKEFFATNRSLGETLDALVRRTRTAIKNRDEGKTKSGLGLLFKLLLLPVWDTLDRFDTIVVAPQGTISLIPFAALYDERCSRFLVEKKNVGTIPSLRTLERCKARYEEVRGSPAAEDWGAAFVAGDPEPMGVGCGQLPGAREEAGEVAKLLGVDAFIGRQVTKQAVIEGLQSKCEVVALVTHGVVDVLYPEGALVMQGGAKQQQKVMQMSKNSKIVDIDRLVLSRQIAPRQSYELLEQRDEVLTAREVEKLDVKAPLVVLSACQTGEGEVPSEGVLGLGRAVLQAGASCAVVMLWRVDDSATKQLMTGTFCELKKGKTVVEALRLSMLKLLHSKAPVYKWAPAMVFGFPMLKLSSGLEVPSCRSSHSDTKEGVPASVDCWRGFWRGFWRCCWRGCCCTVKTAGQGQASSQRST